MTGLSTRLQALNESYGDLDGVGSNAGADFGPGVVAMLTVVPGSLTAETDASLPDNLRTVPRSRHPRPEVRPHRPELA